MKLIDWNQLELNSNNSKEISFERFCYHYAMLRFKGYGKVTYPYNAAGSEFYMELRKPLMYEGKQYKAGDIIGWQAKFWVNHNDMENTSLAKPRRDELKEGFDKTLRRMSKLALWVVCTPGQFQEDAYGSLQTELASVSSKVDISHWHKAVFEESLIGGERANYQGLFAYYFGRKTIGKERLNQLTADAIESLKRKFDIDLHTATSFETQLLAIIDKGTAQNIIVTKLENLRDRVGRYEKRWIDANGVRTGRRDGALSDDVFDALVAYEKSLIGLAKALLSLLTEDDVDLLCNKGLSIIDSKKEDFLKCALRLSVAAKSDGDSYLEYYTEDILSIKNLIIGYRGDREQSIAHTLKLRDAHYFPVFAKAGYGKTHFACSLASEQMAAGMPVLLLTGGMFCKCDRPQDVLISRLGLDGETTFDELLGMLDMLAEDCGGGRLPVIVDGLNESFPNEVVWRNELPAIIRGFAATKHLVLVTTCREKTEYIQKIYSQPTYEKVENATLLKGIEDFNLLDTIHKYFTKYDISEIRLEAKEIFENPLLLRVFCEVNKGATGITVNEYALTECMKRYSEGLVEKLSISDGAIDRVIRHKVSSGLLTMGKLLWERNTRSVDYFDDFYPVFAEKSEALLDEGLCFQVDNVSTDSGDVKFTYDLLAGYHIANYLVSQSKDSGELKKTLHAPNVYSKLFGAENELHSLAEDINQSLLFLVRLKFGHSLLELVGGDDALKRLFNALDMICASQDERETLHSCLSQPLSLDVKRTVCEYMKDKVSKYNSVTGIASLCPAFLQLGRMEFDTLFHCGFLTYGTLDESVNCIKKYLKEDLFRKDAFVCAVLLTGCFERKYRQEMIEVLVRYAREHPEEYLSNINPLLSLNDPYIREAIFIITHGAIVRCGDVEVTKLAVSLLEADLRQTPSSHVIMLDCADSLFDYAQIVHGIAVDKTVLRVAKHDVWEAEDDKVIWKSGVYDYDFEKYHLRPYSVMGYRNATNYTSDQLSNMVLWRMKQCGYDDEKYSQLRTDHSDRMKYYQGSLERVPFKHVETAQRELLGWMMLNNLVEPEYINSFRISEVEIDPSFPRLKPMRQLISLSYLPKTADDKAEWLAEDPLPWIKGNMERALPGNTGEWVLLTGSFEQKCDDKEAQVFWKVDSGLVYKRSRKKKVGFPALSHNHLFASEIGWREMIPNNNDDYYDPSLGMFILQEYEFSSWDTIRPDIRDFYFPTSQILSDFNLEFRVSDLCCYRNDEKVTAVFQDASSRFFFIKKELIEAILERYDVSLVREIFAEKVDKSHEEGSYRWKNLKEYRETIVYGE